MHPSNSLTRLRSEHNPPASHLTVKPREEGEYEQVLILQFQVRTRLTVLQRRERLPGAPDPVPGGAAHPLLTAAADEASSAEGEQRSSGVSITIPEIHPLHLRQTPRPISRGYQLRRLLVPALPP